MSIHEKEVVSTGFHSTISIGYVDGAGSPNPYILKSYGKQNEFEVSEAQQMVLDMRKFTEIGQLIGVHIPSAIGYVIANDASGAPIRLREYAPNAGTDLKKIFSSTEYSDEEVLEYVEKYLEEFKKVWDADFAISLDPVPANFCTNGNGQVVYVDGMPPRQKRSDGSILIDRPNPPAFSKAFIEARYFSPLQARVIYAQLLRSISERSIPPEAIRIKIREVLGEEAFFLVTLSATKRDEVLRKPERGDVDVLRMIAAEDGFSGILTPNQVKAVYDLAHIVNGGILPSLREVEQASYIIRHPAETRDIVVPKSGYAVGPETIGKRIEQEGVNPTKWVILDLDGVVMRWTKANLPNPDDVAMLQRALKQYKELGIGIAILTNRPPGHMAAIAYELGIDYGVWVTESGGSLYDPREHKSMIAPEYRKFKDRIGALRLYLTKTLGISTMPETFDEAQFEPGMGLVKTVIVAPHGVRTDDYASTYVIPALRAGGFLDDFDIKVGKGIDIDPKGLSKAHGMEMLLEENAIDPARAPTIFIADDHRDIEASQVLINHGGRAAAVGNANPEYLQHVRDFGGIVAAEGTRYHSSVVNILDTFLAQPHVYEN